jgi:Transposase
MGANHSDSTPSADTRQPRARVAGAHASRRYGSVFTESHPELPPRQRVTRRFRRRLSERVRTGAAHAEVAREESTSRYQVARAFREAAAELTDRGERPRVRRLSLDEASRRPATSWPRWAPTSTAKRVIEVLDGRDRRTVERYLRELPFWTGSRSTSSRSTPTRPTARRSAPSCRGRSSWSTTSTSCVARTRRSTQSAANGSARPADGGPRAPAWPADLAPGPLPRPRSPAQGPRAAHRARPAAAPPAIRARAAAGRGLGLKETFRSIYRAQDRNAAERRLDAFPAAVERAQIPSFAAFADGVRHWREELLAYFDHPPPTATPKDSSTRSKFLKRRAYGLPTFDGFRERVLLTGRYTP